MVYRPKVDPRLAFVLIPFKPPFESYYEEIIRPAARSVGIEVRKSDEIYSTGPIIQDIWNQIWASTVIIADVTGKNPNVNYELGICHALGVPTVIVTQSLDDVPFDYKHRRCIPYNTDDVDWQRRLKKSIVYTLKQVLAGEDLVPDLSWPYDTSSFVQQNFGSFIPAENARDIVVRGARMVSDALRPALGPRGSHVSVKLTAGQHAYYKSGSEIAKYIHSLDTLKATGVEHARRLATEMHTTCGDGTKSAVIVFQKLLECGSAALKRGHPPSDVVRGMERATESVVAGIRSSRKPLLGDSALQIANTAANRDTGLATLIVDAFKRAGADGLIVIERTSLRRTELAAQEGMHFDRGYVDAGLVASVAQENVLEDPYILLYDSKISSMKDFLPFLEQIAISGAPLLIIADDVEGEALATLIVNRKKGTLNCVAVRSPGFADRRGAILQDIAALTGGTVVKVAEGRRLDGVTLKDLGRARKAIVTKGSTTILGGASESSIGEYVETIRHELAQTKDPFEIEKLRERLAKLSGAIVTIRVGGISAQDIADRAYLAESAMHSLQNAIEEGTVVGGGVSLFRAKGSLATLAFKRPGEAAGVQVLAEALEEPLRQLIINNGGEPSEVVKRIKRSKKQGVGFNSEANDVQDLDALGILDPVGTVTTAMQLAFSHARTILQTGAWDAATGEANTATSNTRETVVGLISDELFEEQEPDNR